MVLSGRVPSTTETPEAGVITVSSLPGCASRTLPDVAMLSMTKSPHGFEKRAMVSSLPPDPNSTPSGLRKRTRSAR